MAKLEPDPELEQLLASKPTEELIDLFNTLRDPHNTTDTTDRRILEKRRRGSEFGTVRSHEEIPRKQTQRDLPLSSSRYPRHLYRFRQDRDQCAQIVKKMCTNQKNGN